jgi:hypothetical protein
MLFQWQVVNVLLILKQPSVGFHAWAIAALKQTNTKTCHVSMGVWCLFLLVENHMPQNMSFKTWTFESTTHRNMSSFGKRIGMRFDAWATRALETYPTKHVTCWVLCFNPIHPFSMLPHVIPIYAPWPIHNTLDLFQLHILPMYFSIELWCFHRHSPTRDLIRVLITKKGHGVIKETISFHPD